MNPEDDYVIGDLIRNAEKILDDLGEVESAVNDLSPDLAERVKVRHAKNELSSIDKEEAHAIDGSFDIRVTKSDMEAVADFLPPQGRGRPVEADDVKAALRAKGVEYGVMEDLIDKCLHRCNVQLEPVTGVVIARGDKPVNQRPAHLVVDEALKEPRAPLPEGGEKRIDYREITSYVLVKKGDILARRVPEREGKFGMTVRGQFIHYRKEHVPPIKPGKNVELRKEGAVATCEGHFIVKGNIIQVNEILDVGGNVDYSTGNISFPGDIVIHGQIKDGFKVEAGGSVICRETLDASDVVCEGDLIIHRGMIGRKNGRAVVGGVVSTNFIENCYVEARGGIYVERGVLYSVLHTLDRIETGKRGVVIGGKVFAKNGVAAAQISNKMGIKTEVYCGIDFTVQQKLDWLREKQNDVALKYSEMEQRIGRGETHPKLIDMRNQLKAALHSLNGSVKRLILDQRKNENAKVIVMGAIYPGTYIEICNASLVVPREMRYVSFALDRKSGKIRTSPARG
jgi:uncharacterized protein (DUF342 family)